jgi:hypothetical protein
MVQKSSSPQAPDRGAAAQHASLAAIMNRISVLDQHSVSENISYFGEVIRKLSRDNIFQLKERFQVYDKVQETLLSIPGHARYFADEIKREQKKVAHSPTITGPRVAYDRNRGKYFMILRHLPSPETIAVLGEFLADDIDTPGPLDPSKSYDYGIPPANSQYSASAIDKIGLRNPPLSPTAPVLMPEDLLVVTRAWWDEIKSGRKTFSFVGQDVEYRFKPDGTWDTIQIGKSSVDGVPGKGKTGDRPIKRSIPAHADTTETTCDYVWWWFGIGGVVLLAVAAWLWRKNQNG